MNHLINGKVKELEISGIRRFFNMVAGTKDMISLTIGQPDFPTPQHIKDAAKIAIDSDYTTYTHNAGYIELRKAATNYAKLKYQLDYDPSSEVIITTGASEAIDITFRTILEEGCEVILPGPVYPGYEPIIRMMGAIPVYVDTRQNQFRMTADLIAAQITPRTRCIVLPYPSNPTGVSLNEREIREIAALLEDKEIFVLADEIYSEIVYDEPHFSIGTILKEKTIVVNGLSKSHSMTGWRIGIIYAPSYLAEQLLKVHQYNVSCASSISQMAAIEALTAGINDAHEMKLAYLQRREFVYQRLIAMNLEVVKPDGAFYYFVKLPLGYDNSFEFALALVEKAGLAVVPGNAFSPLGEGYFRLSFAYSMEVLQEGLNRLEDFLNKNNF